MKTWLMAGVLALSTTAAFAEKKKAAGEAPAPPHRDVPTQGIPEEMPELEETKSLESLKERFPALYEMIRDIRDRYPAEFRQHLRNIMRGVRETKKDPKTQELFGKTLKLRFEANELVGQVRTEEDEKKKEELRGKLKGKLGELFDAQLAMQQTHVERMEKEVSSLKERLEKRRKQKADIVQRRLDEVTGDAEPFEW